MPAGCSAPGRCSAGCGRRGRPPGRTRSRGPLCAHPAPGGGPRRRGSRHGRSAAEVSPVKVSPVPGQRSGLPAAVHLLGQQGNDLLVPGQLEVHSCALRPGPAPCCASASRSAPRRSPHRCLRMAAKQGGTARGYLLKRHAGTCPAAGAGTAQRVASACRPLC